MSPRRLAVAVFFLLALWVHPTQQAVTKVKGTSKDATATPRVTHSLSPFAPSRRPDAHRLNPPAPHTQPSSWRASTPTWAPHTPSRPSTSTETGLNRNSRRSDVGSANTSRRRRKGPRLQSRARRPPRDRVSSSSDSLERRGRRTRRDVTISLRSRGTTSSNTSNLGAYSRRSPRRRRPTSDRRCFLRDETCDRICGATISAVGALRCTLSPPPSRCASQSRARRDRREFSCCSTARTARRRDSNSRFGDERRRRYRIRDARLCRSESLCRCPPRRRTRAARRYCLGRRG